MAFSFDYDAREAFSRIIAGGYAQAVLAGNALATHDLEVASRFLKRLVQAGLFFDGGGWQSVLRRHPLKDLYHESDVCQGFPPQWRTAPLVGESPLRYILLLRIRNAQVLLETTDGTISEIARIVGYENPMYFSRLFRKEKGMSPLKYRKAYLEGSREA